MSVGVCLEVCSKTVSNQVRLCKNLLEGNKAGCVQGTYGR